MSVKKYTNSAWQEIEFARNYVNSAWQDKEAIKAHENGAWVEKWSAGITPTLVSNTITVGTGYNNGTTGYEIYRHTTQNNGSGSIIFQAIGNWSSPLIDLDWEGGFYYMIGYNAIRVSGGTLKITVTANGSASTETIELGSTENEASDITATGHYSRTFSGTVTQVRFEITPIWVSSTFEMFVGDIKISNITIGGKKVKFDDSLDFSR